MRAPSARGDPAVPAARDRAEPAPGPSRGGSRAEASSAKRYAIGMCGIGLRYLAHGMGIACTAANRLRIPLVVGALALATVAAGGCGSTASNTSTDPSPPPIADAKNFPPTKNRSFRDLIGGM